MLSICLLIPNDVVNNVIQVVRGGRRIMVSIYDLVVGDVVPLKIGDQVEKANEQLTSFLSHVSTRLLMMHRNFFARFLQMGSLSAGTPFP